MNKVTGVVLHASSIEPVPRRWVSVTFHRIGKLDEHGRFFGYSKHYFHVSKASQARLLRALGGWQS